MLRVDSLISGGSLMSFQTIKLPMFVLVSLPIKTIEVSISIASNKQEFSLLILASFFILK